MNLLDIVIIFILVSFFAIGTKNGIIKEAVSFVGLIVVFVVAYLVKGYIGDLLCLYLPFFEFYGEIADLSVFNIFMYETIGFIIAYGLLYSVYFIIVKGSAIIQKVLNLTIVLILPSKILGGILSVLKCWLFLFVLLIALMLPLGNQDMMKNSKLTNMIIYKTPLVSQYTEKFTSSVKEIYDITSKLAKEEKNGKESNAECLDIMLKYKVVGKDLVNELIENEKIKKDSYIEKVLEKY